MNQIILKYKISTEAAIFIDSLKSMAAVEIKEKLLGDYPKNCGLEPREYKLALQIAYFRRIHKELEISFESKTISVELKRSHE